MTKVAVVTPTYNRSGMLVNAYRSLVNQIDKNFRWIIIDDGSTDNTEAQVRSFVLEAEFDIVYQKKENGGKHTALNYSYNYLLDEEMVLILDSDDVLTEDAVESVVLNWNKYGEAKLCGIVFLKGSTSDQPIGDKFPSNYYYDNYMNIRINKQLRGDKVEIFRAEILKKYPFPVFENEKFLGESVVWAKISLDYDMLHINKIIYLCEYLQDGLTNLGRSLRVRCPYGGMEYAKTFLLDKRVRFKRRFKFTILYICYAKLAGLSLKQAWKRLKMGFLLFVITIPFSYLLYLKWKTYL